LVTHEQSELLFVVDVFQAASEIVAVELQVEAALAEPSVLGEPIDLTLLNDVDGLIVLTEFVAKIHEVVGVFPRQDLETAREAMRAIVLRRGSLSGLRFRASG
jgi:hypothetical protein